ncbi:ATP-grasp domain-containing protein [Marinimicrobium alkaliphilum]|uniref:ATP-grasp domain-containing protein n=1 Tax=Marinimicrobium alkaliphilum TaxID=2202654 RepID=UPI000DB95C64|nr:ATP-grasp domain-containing protein [Marinimicrobium alkaliphilum]
MSRPEEIPRRNIFVLGYDLKHQSDVEDIRDIEDINIHALLHTDEVANQDGYDIEAMLIKARMVLDQYDSVDGIVCHWDFPGAALHAILCKEYQLPGPTLESVIKCSHKYWSRLEQRRLVPEHTPDFCAVDPFDDKALEKITVAFPFWLKPIKGYSSMLGFHVTNEQEFDDAISKIRRTIGLLGDPFDNILARIELPQELHEISGNFLIAEQYVRGWELAPEGYVQSGKCHVHGIIDMVIGSNGKSFERYEYPSCAPEPVQKLAISVSCRFMEHIGFDSGCFNIEFFWDDETDKLWIIEINPRISQSHSYLFEQVKGLSNHEVAVQVALGERPRFDQVSGRYKRAAKFLHRRYSHENMVAKRVPTAEDIAAFQKNVQPDTRVYVWLEEGDQLTDLRDQDPYSYVIADMLIAAQSREQLEQKYQEASDSLPFEFEALEASLAVPEADVIIANDNTDKSQGTDRPVAT